jgi:hypothetical protein
MYNGPNNPTKQQVRLAILEKLAYDPYYAPDLERAARRRRRTTIARALELGGLATTLGAQALRSQNPALARQIATLGALGMGVGGGMNLFGGNKIEGLVFGGVPLIGTLIGMGGMKNLSWKMDVNAGHAPGYWRQAGRGITWPFRAAGRQIYNATGDKLMKGLQQHLNGMKAEEVMSKQGSLNKFAYNAYIMPEYSRIEDEEEERRRAAKRAWRTYAAVSGLAGAGMIALKGNDKTWANVGRALSASSLAASLGTGSWTTAATNGALWGLGEWLRPRGQNNNQQNNGTNPPQPPTPPNTEKQQNNTNTAQQNQKTTTAADLSAENLEKTAAQQIQIIRTFQGYYMLKSAQNAELETLVEERLVKTAAPIYEGYHPGLYFDEYEERRRRRRETRNLFNALTWGGLAANIGANFVKDPLAKKQLATAGRWIGWGGILGNTFTGNIRDALAGMSGRAIAWNTMRKLRNIEEQHGGGGILSGAQEGVDRLWGNVRNFFSNMFKGEQNNNTNNNNPNNNNPDNQPPTPPKEEEKVNTGGNK